MKKKVYSWQNRKRTIYKCPACDGAVRLEKLNERMMFVVCVKCNAVFDYYDPKYKDNLIFNI